MEPRPFPSLASSLGDGLSKLGSYTAVFPALGTFFKPTYSYCYCGLAERVNRVDCRHSVFIIKLEGDILLSEVIFITIHYLKLQMIAFDVGSLQKI